MSISFQSTSTNNNNNNNNNASICKNAETSTVYVTPSQVAMAVASVQQRAQQPSTSTNGHVLIPDIPPLLPNSALYQYNNEQMMHMQEFYDENFHRSQSDTSGRSTDV
jgi:hypothetical protein